MTLRPQIPLDTFGKLSGRGHRVLGSCLRCAVGYRPALAPRNDPNGMIYALTLLRRATVAIRPKITRKRLT